jgi:hypothetical protein
MHRLSGGIPPSRGRRLIPTLGVRQATLLLIVLTLALPPGSSGSSEAESWLVRAGKNFQHAGEYTIRLRNKRFEDAIAAYGEPSECRVQGSPNHAVATWADRGIWIELWTYGLMPEGETGCSSPDLIWVSEIRLRDRRWSTSLGLRVGDRTTKLRKRYPKAVYQDRRAGGPRSQYWLVKRHGTCLGDCTPKEQRDGVEYPVLAAQVRNGRVVAFWLPVFGQGE